MAKPMVITAEAFGRALAEAGIIHDPHRVARIVIDAQAGHVVIMHVQYFGDERLLQVAMTLDGIKVTTGGDDG